MLFTNTRLRAVTPAPGAASGLRVPHSTKPVAALPSPQQEGLSLLLPTWSNALGAGGGATCGFLPLGAPPRTRFSPLQAVWWGGGGSCSFEEHQPREKRSPHGRGCPEEGLLSQSTGTCRGK